MVVLHFRRFDERPQQPRAPVRRRLLQVRITALHVLAQQRRGPLRALEVRQRVVDVVRQVPLRLAQVLDAGGLALQTRLEHREHHQVRIRVRRNRPDLHPRTPLVADRNADHRAPVHRRRLDLVRRFEVRIQPPVRVHARVQQQADIVAVRQNPVQELPPELAQLLLALRIPEQVLAVLAHRNVGVHPAAVHPNHRLGQEARAHPHLVRHLAADELVKLDLVRRRHYFGVAIVDLELRGRNFRVILLVLEAHRALHFRRAVDELPQIVARQRVVVAARVHILELAGLVVVPLRVHALEQEPFDFVGRVQRVALLLVQPLREVLQHPADVARVRAAVLVDHLAEHQHLARTEVVRRRPVERAPVHVQPQVALPLRRESTDRRSVERQVVVALYEKFLVVIEHVEPAFQVAEQDRDGLDALLVRQVLEALLLNHMHRNAVHPLLLGREIQLLKLCVGEG